jgi:hypothetical protein
MKKIQKIVVAAAVFVMALSVFSYCETISAEDLVARYRAATELGRPGIAETYKYSAVSINGTITDVQSWDAFDEVTDTRKYYYRVVTAPQQTKAGVTYEVLVFYKDKTAVESLVKGQKIETDAALLNISDEISLVSVAVFAGTPTDEDKAMLGRAELE